MNWTNLLVCPNCKTKMQMTTIYLTCRVCNHKYPIEDSVPIFLSQFQVTNWSKTHNLNLDRINLVPLPEHTYYTQFTSKWERMLDLGGGDGVMSSGSANKVKQIFCVDSDLMALQILKKREYSNMHPVCAFGETLPFTENFFDGVFNIFVIEHLKNPISILREIYRVLKPRGELIIATDTKYYDKYLKTITQTIKNRKLIFCRSNPNHINLMVPSDLRKLLKNASFQIIDEYMHYFVRESRWRKFPKAIRERFLTSMFVFKCRPIIKDEKNEN